MEQQQNNTALHNKINHILSVLELLQAAVASGDDVTKEIMGGLALIQGALLDATDLIKK